MASSLSKVWKAAAEAADEVASSIGEKAERAAAATSAILSGQYDRRAELMASTADGASFAADASVKAARDVGDAISSGANSLADGAFSLASKIYERRDLAYGAAVGVHSLQRALGRGHRTVGGQYR